MSIKDIISIKQKKKLAICENKLIYFKQETCYLCVNSIRYLKQYEM